MFAKDISDKESKIYNLIKNKLLASCSDNLKESSRKIRYEYDKFNFNASGKTIIDEGYTKYLKSYGKEKQKNELPDIKTGDKIKLTSKNISEKFTKAPSHYNEDTLLKAMENAGIESLDKDIEVERKGRKQTNSPENKQHNHKTDKMNSAKYLRLGKTAKQS